MNTRTDLNPAAATPLSPPSSTAEAVDRREMLDRLLKIGAGSLAIALAAGGSISPIGSALAAGDKKGQKKGQKYRYGMVVDTRRCVGCKACMVACKAENKTPPGVSYTVVVENGFGERPGDRPLFMTKPCFHCDEPPCTKVCPVGATFKRKQDGIVVVDYDRCIGCRYCIVACPYQARYADFGENYPVIEEKTPYAGVPSPEYRQFRKREKGKSPEGNARKCTFCLHLQDENGQYNKAAGRWPACAKTCTGHAIHFGDFNDPDSDVSQLLAQRQPVRLKEELGTAPNVYYLL
jgi:molybdopterin-containing oxidoreductase family iron-sulfur binding subunit